MTAVDPRLRSDAPSRALSEDNITTTVWRSRVGYGEPFDLEDLSEIMNQDDLLFWVDLVDVDDGHDALLKELADELGFPQASVKTAIDNGLRPKAARHSTHTFITTFATDLVATEDAATLKSRVAKSRISAFLLAHGLVTVRHDNQFDMDKLVKRWASDRHLWALGSGALLYDLFDLLVDEHFETINLLQEEVEELEGELFALLQLEESGKPSNLRKLNRGLQVKVFRLRKELVDLRRVVLPMREVVNIVDHDPLGGAKDKELDELFDELSEQILRLTEWTDSLHDLVTAVYETNLAAQDNALNEIMKKLTGWAAIIAVPTLITGWFGQNVYYPGANASSGLIASTVMIFAIALPLWWFFKRRDWI